MEYRASGKHCAVIFDLLKLPISNTEALDVLINKGFILQEVDMIKLARQCIGTSQYNRGAKLTEAPNIFDCSSFTKWIYSNRGIWLPRRSIQQREYGEIVKIENIESGDLIFVSGWIDYFDNDPKNGVGHVGIATNNGTIIHAANKEAGVVETSIDKFIGKNKFRGARRYIPKNVEVLTFETPLKREVETSDDIRWIILQTLPK